MLTSFAILTDGLVYAAYLFLVAVGASVAIEDGIARFVEWYREYYKV